MWLRSVLNDEPPRAGGGDWDVDTPSHGASHIHAEAIPEIGYMLTVEEILRAWARDSAAFVTADEKVRLYLEKLEDRATESGATADAKLLQEFRRTWNTLAMELR